MQLHASRYQLWKTLQLHASRYQLVWTSQIKDRSPLARLFSIPTHSTLKEFPSRSTAARSEHLEHLSAICSRVGVGGGCEKAER